MQKNILITGGGSGIGQAIAWNLANLGFKVYIVGRNLDKLQSTHNKYPNLIKIIQADITNFSTHEKIKNAIEEMSLNYLVHNAGIAASTTRLLDIEPDSFQTLMKTNVDAPIFLTKSLLPLLTQARILNISSRAAHEAISSLGAYCVSKASLFMIKNVLNNEYHSEFLVGSLMPGVVETDIQTSLIDSSTDGFRDYLLQMKQQNRMVQPSHVAKFVNYLLLKTPDKAFINDDWDIYDTEHHQFWLGKDSLPMPL